MLKINEIFYSIQGESTYAGQPTVFVRTTGCNLRCIYCDTTYAYYEGEHWAADKILEKIKAFKTKYVCFTGGEPLLQKEVLPLMKALCDESYFVSLETSGSKCTKDVDPRIKIILDIKTPDSGAPDSFLEENLNFLNVNTEIKFVICSEKDFLWSNDFAKRHELFEKYTVLFSPSFGKISERWLAEKILENNSSARLQLQQHKYIWSPETRGV
ncbi:MAG: radical SAM protein [Pseudobdellovibrionaceae bacterium]